MILICVSALVGFVVGWLACAFCLDGPSNPMD